jgi:hypothetical protein
MTIVSLKDKWEKITVEDADPMATESQAFTRATSDPCWERLWRQKARFSATLAKCISAQPLVSICIRCTPVPS